MKKSRKYLIDINDISISAEKKNKARFRKVWIGGSTISLILGVFFTILFFNFFDSPAEKKLKNQINAYQIKFKMLNSNINLLKEGIESIQEKDDNTYRVIFEMPSFSKEMRKAGVGGSENYKEFFQSENTKIAGYAIKDIDLIIRKMQVQEKSFEEVEKNAHEKWKMLASIPSIMPVSRERIRVSSFFGWRRNPFNRKVFKFHHGIDLSGRTNTPIYSTGDGVVEKSEVMRGYGVVVVLNHGYGYKSLYAHLSRAVVKKGEKVKRGQVIGKLGNTGSSTGPHLHYEVIKHGKKVNPMHYIASSLSKDEYDNIINQATELN